MTKTGTRLLVLALIGLAGLTVSLIVAGHPARVQTVTVITSPKPKVLAGQAGLVAADQQFMQAQDVVSRRRNAPTWTLGYIVSSASPAGANVLNWVLTLDAGQPQWFAVTARFGWNGSRWVPSGISFIQPLGSTPRDYDKFAPFAS